MLQYQRGEVSTLSLPSLLTGWLAGPQVEKLNAVSEDKILKMAISSLSEIFKIEEDRITQYLVASHLANWNSDPFTLGAYAYAMVNTSEARKVLNEPVDKTLYFGGEALYEGAEMGTVEAALASGKNVARRIIEDH
jgi:monoamine oxidase